MEIKQAAMKCATAFTAMSICVGSAASAATTTAHTVDPLVSLSVFGTSASRAAVCAAGAQSAAVAGQAVVAAQGAQPGCVLPVTGTPAAAPTTSQAPVYTPAPAVVPAAATGAGIGSILPLVLGLGALIGGAYVLFDSEDGDGDGDLRPDPISPA